MSDLTPQLGDVDEVWDGGLLPWEKDSDGDDDRKELTTECIEKAKQKYYKDEPPAMPEDDQTFFQSLRDYLALQNPQNKQTASKEVFSTAALRKNLKPDVSPISKARAKQALQPMRAPPSRPIFAEPLELREANQTSTQTIPDPPKKRAISMDQSKLKPKQPPPRQMSVPVFTEGVGTFLLSTPPIQPSVPSKPSKRGRKSMDMTGLQFLESLGKMKQSELKQQYTNLREIIEHANSLPTGVKGSTFDGTRIIPVNPGKNANAVTPNFCKMLKRLFEHGVTLVPPEGFRSSLEPTHIKHDLWTTHVVVHQPGNKSTRFPEALKLIGWPGQDIKVEELGDRVCFVSEKWMQNSILHNRITEVPYLLEDDPRSVKKSSPSKRPIETVSVDSDPNSSPTRRHKKGKIVEKITHVGEPVTESLNFFQGLEDQLRMIKELEQVGFDEEVLFKLEDFTVPGDGSTLGNLILSIRPGNDEETDWGSDGPETPTRAKASPSKGPSSMVPTRSSPRKSHARFVCDKASTLGHNKRGPNEKLASVLETLGELVTKCTDKDVFRERSYRVASGVLRNTSKAITTYDEAVQLRGIGHKMALKIVEILKTGTHRKLDMATEQQRAIKVFCGIYGVGQVTAEKYWNNGCRTIDDVKKYLLATRSSRRGASTTAQLLGIKYYDDLAKRIPRAEVEEILKHCKEVASKLDPKLQLHCMGSFRRGQSTCGDIDILVTRDPSDGNDHRKLISKLIERLSDRQIIHHALSQSQDPDALDFKFMGLAALPQGGNMRRIDILGVPWDELPAALIYFTGNDHFNRSMRLKAQMYGMSLNQRGLYKNITRNKSREKINQGQKIACRTEEDIFKALDIPWRPPHERQA